MIFIIGTIIIIVLSCIALIDSYLYSPLKERCEELEQKNKEYQQAEMLRYGILNSRLMEDLGNLQKEVKALDILRKERQENLDFVVKTEVDLVKAQTDLEKEVIFQRMNEFFAKNEEELINNFLIVREDKINEIQNLDELIDYNKKELDEIEGKIKSVNKSIELLLKDEMEKDYHRIIVSEENKEDIAYLLKIEKELHNKEILRKLIYENYIRAPLMKMQKRVLNNEDFSGIYKITSSDGRCYIGKAASIKKRWISHCKEALNIGGISHSLIHNALKERGWDDFTWEVLERCDKDRLGEREKYYIDFYDSKTVGWNMKAGG